MKKNKNKKFDVILAFSYYLQIFQIKREYKCHSFQI
jgi:hypothetical protein